MILLVHRVQDGISTRRLRIVKYRGSSHGTNDYPFLIDEHGISVLPITSLALAYDVSSERLSTGIAELDEMLDGKGFYRGSSILLSGSSGTGKTSFAAHFADSVCRRGEKCVYFSFEESREQLARNMRSVGLDLDQWEKSGLLTTCSARPTAYGLESHLVSMYRTVMDHAPAAVVVDPATSLISAGTRVEVTNMLLRLFDVLKEKQITAYFTHLLEDPQGGGAETNVSSMVDTWLVIRNVESEAEWKRELWVLKSRGMPHSMQVREFDLTGQGVKIRGFEGNLRRRKPGG